MSTQRKLVSLALLIILGAIFLSAQIQQRAISQPRLVPVEEIRRLVNKVWINVSFWDVAIEIPVFEGETLVGVLNQYKNRQRQFAIGDKNGENILVYVKSGYDYFLNHMNHSGKVVPANIRIFIPGERNDLFYSAFGKRTGVVTFEGGTNIKGESWITVSYYEKNTLVEGYSDDGYVWVFEVVETGKSYSNLSDAMRAALRDKSIDFPSWIW